MAHKLCFNNNINKKMGDGQGQALLAQGGGRGSDRSQLCQDLLCELGHQIKCFRFFHWGGADAARCPCHVIGRRIWGDVSETNF